MQVTVDEMGNERVVVTPGEKPKKSKKIERRNDVMVAAEVLLEWGRPLAYQAGQFWSYHPDLGWEICTNQLQVLANELRGAHTEGSVMKIIAAQRAVPDLELVDDPATYWEWAGDKWIPFPVGYNQVLFANCLLDLETMEFTPTEQRIVFGPRVSVAFDPENRAVCEEFEKLVEYALPDQEQREYLQSLCSLVLQPHVVLRGQIVFVGVPHSGKSTLATAIATAPGGPRGMSTANEKRLVRDKWAATMLVNKFVNCSHDSDLTSHWEAWMKQYTTGSFIAEPKFGRPVTCPSTAKLISTCNEFQPTVDLSGAANQRYKVFRFDNPIAETGEHGQSRFMSPGYWAEPERRMGIINWLLDGLERVIKRGLHEPESLKQVKGQAMCESNAVLEFVTNDLESAPDEFTPSADLLAALGDSSQSAARQLVRYIKRVWGIDKGFSKDKKARGYHGIKIR